VPAPNESTDDGVDFLDAGDLLRLLHRIDDADMAAGADRHQPEIADVVAGRVFVDVFVGTILPSISAGR